MKVGDVEYRGGVADLPCPDCAVYMPLVVNPYRGGGAVYYRCQMAGCRGSHGAAPDGAPLGRPGGPPTRDARVRAHEAFEAFVAGMGMRRGDGYRWLAKQLQIDVPECHMSRFDVPTCERVIALCATFARPDSAVVRAPVQRESKQALRKRPSARHRTQAKHRLTGRRPPPKDDAAE